MLSEIIFSPVPNFLYPPPSELKFRNLFALFWQQNGTFPLRGKPLSRADYQQEQKNP